MHLTISPSEAKVWATPLSSINAMKKTFILLFIAAALAVPAMTLSSLAAEPRAAGDVKKPFPAHWGEPPKVQTRDYVPLAGGYGYGSSTLSKWVTMNMEKDRLAANRPKPYEPSVAKPAPEKPAIDKPAPEKIKTARPEPEKPAPAKLETTQRAEPEKAKKITTQERKVIEDYVTKHQESESSGKARGKGKGKGQTKKTLPPGLAKKVERTGELPPGWQDKLVVGETMPEPVLQQAQPLPKEITAQLPPPPDGTINVVLEGKVVRVLQKTRQILDVLDLNK